jgi:nicotinic acid mononucleotide adenylyltransferase
LPRVVEDFIAPRRAAPSAVAAAPHGCVVPIAMAPVEASATEVRALLAQPPSPAADARLAQLLPAAVLDYIRAHRFYR